MLPAHFARLPRYLEFLDEVRDKRWRNRYMTLEEQRNPSGKERAFVLSREFYAQVRKYRGRACVFVRTC